MNKFALALTLCAAMAPGIVAAGNAQPATTEPEPAADPFAPSSLAAGSLGAGGAAVAAVVGVAVVAGLASSSGGSTD